LGSKPLPPWNAGIYDRVTQSLVPWVRILYKNYDMATDKKIQGRYTCTDYRSEMILLGLTRRLQAEGLDSPQAEELLRQIKDLEAEMGMD
jgi:hypothetical protein